MDQDNRVVIASISRMLREKPEIDLAERGGPALEKQLLDRLFVVPVVGRARASLATMVLRCRSFQVGSDTRVSLIAWVYLPFTSTGMDSHIGPFGVLILFRFRQSRFVYCASYSIS